MKLLTPTLLTTTALLTTLTTASLQSIISPLSPSSNLTASIQIPCCTKPPCPGCPASRGNLTELLSISYPSTGFTSLIRNPPGCGEGFSQGDCLRFFQVTLLQLDGPLGISAKKAEGDVRGCGEESSAGECLRYLKGFFEEVRTPLERTLDGGSVVGGDAPPAGDTPVGDGNQNGNGYGEGESESEGEKGKSEL